MPQIFPFPGRIMTPTMPDRNGMARPSRHLAWENSGLVAPRLRFSPGSAIASGQPSTYPTHEG